MKQQYSISLATIANEFHLTPVVQPENYNEIKVESTEVNRPGLTLAGFHEAFEPERIQLIGKAECKYLALLDEETRDMRLREFIDASPVAVIYTTNLPVHFSLKQEAIKMGVPVLTTPRNTSQMMAMLISSLSVYLAPRMTRHGVLVEIYGEGLLLLGDSGIGKSETAVELIKRGHRLIADDAVEIKKVSDRTLVGSAPDLIKHYIEIRGVGIVDVRRLFGMGAIKDTQQIDLVVQMENWVEGKMYERLGMDEEYIDILGNRVPTITVPVRPGRNLAVVLEVAAMNQRQRKMGYNTAREFNERLVKLGEQ